MTGAFDSHDLDELQGLDLSRVDVSVVFDDIDDDKLREVREQIEAGLEKARTDREWIENMSILLKSVPDIALRIADILA